MYSCELDLLSPTSPSATMYYDRPVCTGNTSNNNERPVVLPSIGRIFDGVPRRGPPELTLPPLRDSQRSSRSDTWSQYTQYGVHDYPSRTATQSYYLQTRGTRSPPYPYVSAYETDRAVQEARSYSSGSKSQKLEYYSPSGTGWQKMRSPSPYDYPSEQQARRYDPIATHRRAFSYSEIQHSRTPSPTLYRRQVFDKTSSSPSSSSKHVCNYCGKRFSRPSGLKIHLTTHTGDKPYICPEEGCGRAFSVRSNMRRHGRIVHHVMPEAQTASESGDDARSRDE